ncbi:RluA family pseudouridine synthase [Fructilactobacillus fructivorans]|uniref:Pseudouridine synthase n=1 Tax=Fructilactobacillus fructivorans TaxID=1614 RepID=A0AAE6P0Y4_9LACO|nr:RluA family pseudouridine synthase [Fructilactobacillus fructivorans]KRK58837.1 RluA family pseudouridine synthase [Fructilactobacillus fructivorans]KRN39550.1 RluA family pseudouridine synthase [Fructilactobacillus fructivorans]KRN43269.1 RluA family pseudouridine synthase [Fructilactobacillus fructivorans]QFX92829.1 RluA family pseudouridine synthase [Fructilactobacillus fructivorans]RDV65579.1 RluA family pseudouridine synthase [Fructilactobacillus fructivorans]
MISFAWIYDETHPMKVRTFVMKNGVTRSLLKDIRYHGGHLMVNGHDVYTSFELSHGDRVRIILPPERQNDFLQVSNLPIKILFENDNFLIVDKPAGLASVPSHIYPKDTILNRVLGYYLRNDYPSKKVHVVNRLDRDTSGPVMFAKNHLAHSVLDKQLQDRKIEKNYVAVISGELNIKHGEIVLPIVRKPGSFIEREVRDDGKYCRTEFWTLKVNNGMSLVKIRLHTGRTHQIRVHFAKIGYPLVGDWLYNPNAHSGEYQKLHCYQTIFFDPFEKKKIKVRSKIPIEFKNLLN